MTLSKPPNPSYVEFGHAGVAFPSHSSPLPGPAASLEPAASDVSGVREDSSVGEDSSILPSLPDKPRPHSDPNSLSPEKRVVSSSSLSKIPQPERSPQGISLSRPRTASPSSLRTTPPPRPRSKSNYPSIGDRIRRLNEALPELQTPVGPPPPRDAEKAAQATLQKLPSAPEDSQSYSMADAMETFNKALHKENAGPFVSTNSRDSGGSYAPSTNSELETAGQKWPVPPSCLDGDPSVEDALEAPLVVLGSGPHEETCLCGSVIPDLEHQRDIDHTPDSFSHNEGCVLSPVASRRSSVVESLVSTLPPRACTPGGLPLCLRVGVTVPQQLDGPTERPADSRRSFQPTFLSSSSLHAEPAYDEVEEYDKHQGLGSAIPGPWERQPGYFSPTFDGHERGLPIPVNIYGQPIHGQSLSTLIEVTEESRLTSRLTSRRPSQLALPLMSHTGTGGHSSRLGDGDSSRNNTEHSSDRDATLIGMALSPHGSADLPAIPPPTPVEPSKLNDEDSNTRFSLTIPPRAEGPGGSWGRASSRFVSLDESGSLHIPAPASPRHESKTAGDFFHAVRGLSLFPRNQPKRPAYEKPGTPEKLNNPNNSHPPQISSLGPPEGHGDGPIEMHDMNRIGASSHSDATLVHKRRKSGAIAEMLTEFLKKILKFIRKNSAWILSVLAFVAVVAIVVPLVMLYVVLPAESSKMINQATLKVDDMSIIGLSPVSARVGLTTSLSVDAPHPAVLPPFALRLSLSGRPELYKRNHIPGHVVDGGGVLGWLRSEGDIKIPKGSSTVQVKLSGSEGGTFHIADQNAWAKIMTRALDGNETVAVEMKGDVKINQGRSDRLVPVRKLVQLPTLGGLDLTSRQYSFAGNEGHDISAQFAWTSQSTVTAELGIMSFDILLDDQIIGNASTDPLVVHPGSDTISVRGMLDKEFLAKKPILLGELFSFIHPRVRNESKLFLHGTGTSVDGHKITWLDDWMKSLSLVLPGKHIPVDQSMDGNACILSNVTLALKKNKPHVLSGVLTTGVSLGWEDNLYNAAIIELGASLVVSNDHGSTASFSYVPVRAREDKNGSVLAAFDNASFSTDDISAIVKPLLRSKRSSTVISGNATLVLSSTLGNATMPEFSSLDGNWNISGLNSFSEADTLLFTHKIVSANFGTLTLLSELKMESQSNVALKMGAVSFSVLDGDSPIGTLLIPSFDLAPGPNTIPANLTVLQAAPERFLTSFVSAEKQSGTWLSVSIQGSNSSSDITPLAASLDGLVANASLWALPADRGLLGNFSLVVDQHESTQALVHIINPLSPPMSVERLNLTLVDPSSGSSYGRIEVHTAAQPTLGEGDTAEMRVRVDMIEEFPSSGVTQIEGEVAVSWNGFNVTVPVSVQQDVDVHAVVDTARVKVPVSRHKEAAKLARSNMTVPMVVGPGVVAHIPVAGEEGDQTTS